MQRCYFVSDLHLFSSRSHGARHLGAMIERAQKAEAFVLGGDIFDFKWSRATTLQHSVADAIAWLDALVRAVPNCHFYYLLGNHDCVQPFVAELGAWAQSAETRALGNFSWDPHHLRLGSSVFLHGDVADDVMDSDRLTSARAHWAVHKTCTPAMHRLYDLAVTTRLHTPIPTLVYPKRRIAKRILSYLECVGHGPTSGVQHVYFGHTHRHFTNYPFRGVQFHTGGAPIRGMKFQILEAVV